MSATTRYFFVDLRQGCIAVRDDAYTDAEYQGLHADTPGVVWFRMGERREQDVCPACGNRSGFVGWVVSSELQKEAQTECDRLNAGEKK